MRIVSMVPSWTETLLACGANVVGRTRYCVHPRTKVTSIRVVGGTKDIDWKKIESLAPDLLLLDREENPKSMFDDAARHGVRAILATHVTDTTSVAAELERLGEAIALGSDEASEALSPALLELARRWRRACGSPAPLLEDWRALPGVLEWVREPRTKPASYAYLIWRKPYMAVGPGTFIASMLERLGLPRARLEPAASRLRSAETGALKSYPELTLDELAPETVLLFSSEPYPFARKRDWIGEVQGPCAIVDGECFSWFGVRSLEFLEKAARLE